MNRITHTALTLIVLLMAGTMAGCNGSSESSVTIADQWARPGFEGDNAAAYMEIQNDGDEDIALIGASSDIADTVEIHQTRMESPDQQQHGDDDADNDDTHGNQSQDHSTMMVMEEVESIVAPSGSSVLLEPGGYHVMFMGLTRDLEPGDSFSLTLHFDDIDDQTIEVTVEEQ
jgi:periplasmic copper chaperone A